MAKRMREYESLEWTLFSTVITEKGAPGVEGIVGARTPTFGETGHVDHPRHTNADRLVGACYVQWCYEQRKAMEAATPGLRVVAIHAADDALEAPKAVRLLWARYIPNASVRSYLRCPRCAHVIDAHLSVPSEGEVAITRQRTCSDCGAMLTVPVTGTGAGRARCYTVGQPALRGRK